MSSAQFNAGQTKGQAQAKTEEWVQSAQNTANKACDKMADSRESAEHGKEEAAGFLQQTGEQVMHMAQGAIDGVKNTLGMNEKK
ncbi:Late embryogenesis abundant protein [Actinidia chinensis var. chinensis]|uniref:Late embryogenesis abundant protein (LEA) family protein n=2 Tax=Actinidia TaxID=3624 RepID=A0A7J0E8K0_9ERIC|nr:late embryogenesis abundant protein 1-like [Actinidia eriantha]PSS00226.1 Late embryogenesis abundant protein [Actinidia chinensis var. chinensis]GFY82814.1 late embryogenesis abundant protein (LEA) family protein [Actinidia rufa]